MSYEPSGVTAPPPGQTDAIVLLPEISALEDEMIANRRWFHQHPELSFQEINTAKKVAELLRSYGVDEVLEGCGRTGVVGLIKGGAGPVIGLRADMDALPLQEVRPDIPWASATDGVMHACGHDGHMSSLLAAAKVLVARKEVGKLHGTVKLLFQPAEEGHGGARAMIADGVLEDGRFGPRVDAVYGCHLWSYGLVSQVGARKGAMMAASDRWDAHVYGKGGHGAAPQSTVDAVVVAANLVTALQTVISRSKDPLEAGVLTCGTMNTVGSAGYNIISDHVHLSGTTRSFSTDTQRVIETRMKEVCCGIGAAYGANIDVQYKYGYPPTVNTDEAAVDRLHAAAKKVVGKGAGVPFITCGAEDFSYFLQQRPGCFFFVGAALPGELRPHHKSVFDFDEKAMGVAASVFVHLIDDLIGPGAQAGAAAAAATSS